jgi:VanZ family protein
MPLNKNGEFLSRLVRYGPLLVWIGFISFASTHGFSSGNTSRIIRPLLIWLFPDIPEYSLTMIHGVVRKVAHFVEYAILAFLARRAFVTSSAGFVRQYWFTLSLLLVVVMAVLDEYHQRFVPSRTGSIYDSFIDIAGGLTVLIIAGVYSSRRTRRVN